MSIWLMARRFIMPIYQYECDACNHSFEELQTIGAAKLKKCPACGKNKLVRLIGSGSGIIFKGSGFYETDFKNKSAASVESKTSESACSHGSDSCACA